MHIRIQLSNPTVKALHSRLQQAYRQDNVRLVRRLTVLIDLLVYHISVDALAQRWGLSSSTFQFGSDKARSGQARFLIAPV